MGWEGGHFNHRCVQFADIFESDTGHTSRKAASVKPSLIGCPQVAKDTEVNQN